MRLEQYYENMDVRMMHAGENAPHAYFIPFEKGQDACAPRAESRRLTRRARGKQTLYAPQRRVGFCVL